MTEIAMPQRRLGRDRLEAPRRAPMQRFAVERHIFFGLTLAAALLVLLILGGVIVSLIAGLASRPFRPSASVSSRPRSGTRSPRSSAPARPIYGTLVTSLIAMVIAVPVGLGIAIFLTELCPPMLAPADRHRHRAAGRHSQHHLRHLGLVRLRAVPAAIRPAGLIEHSSATSRSCHRSSPGRPTASAC